MTELRLTLKHLADERSGFVYEIHVNDGEVVREGRLLFTLMTGDYWFEQVGAEHVGKAGRVIVEKVFRSPGERVLRGQALVEFRTGPRWWHRRDFIPQARASAAESGASVVVAQVLVKEGDSVGTGDRILACISNPRVHKVEAPVDGLIHAVRVNPDQLVNVADVLLEFEDIPRDFEEAICRRGLGSAQAVVSPSSGKCQNKSCAATNAPEAVYCGRCGSKLTGDKSV